MRDVKIAVVGIPGKWSTEVLADAIEARTSFRLVVDMASVRADLGNGSLWAGDIDLCKLDGLIVKKICQSYSAHTLDRIELLRLPEHAGVRVFSRPDVIIRMIDRLSCTLTLRNAGIPMPETTVTEDRDEALRAIQNYGAAVLKPLYSTKARGMRVVEAHHGDAETLKTLDVYRSDNPMMYIQKRITLPGQDLGMVFLGGRYVGTYARLAQAGSWNTAVDGQGRYTSHDPPRSTIELAARAQSAFGMDFTTVDVADTAEGPVVFEVSAFGGFRGAKEGIGIDAAAMYADYVLSELQA